MQSVVCTPGLVEGTAEEGVRERRKLDTPMENSLGACTREDVGEMRSNCPERATHSILRGCKACRWAMENPGLSQTSSSHGLYNVGEEMKPLGG